MTRTFKELPVGAKFIWGTNLCEKRSTRTATLLEYGRWFYFAATERVKEVKE